MLYGDTYLRIDYAAVDRAAARGRRADDRAAQRGPLGHLQRRLRGRARLRHDKARPTPDMHWIDYGLGGLRAEALRSRPGDDLAEVYRALARRGELAGYEATERFYEIGTPDALAETSAFLSSSSGIRRA